MTREEFRYYAAGQFSLGKPTIKVDELRLYVEAALMAWDMVVKLKTEDRLSPAPVDQKRFIPQPPKT